MNLKKSDKMIAVVGVIILVFAAIGIVMFTPDDGDDNGDGDGAEEIKKYMINPVPKVGIAVPDPDPTGQKVTEKIIGDGSYMGEVSIPLNELVCVKFHVEYEDNIKINFLGNMGADTLTFTVYDENDNQLDSKSITKMGNDTIILDVVSDHLSIREIKAENENTAWDRLEENMTDTGMQKTYKITVSVNQKETIFRPIAWLLEKIMQDKFSLEVTYDYLDYELEEIDTGGDGGDEPPADQGINNLSLTYLSTNYIGRH